MIIWLQGCLVRRCNAQRVSMGRQVVLRSQYQGLQFGQRKDLEIDSYLLGSLSDAIQVTCRHLDNRYALCEDFVVMMKPFPFAHFQVPKDSHQVHPSFLADQSTKCKVRVALFGPSRLAFLFFHRLLSFIFPSNQPLYFSTPHYSLSNNGPFSLLRTCPAIIHLYSSNHVCFLTILLQFVHTI